MQQIYYCPQCGGNVQYGIVRCPSCGCPLYWQPTTPAQEQQYTPPPDQFQPPPAPQGISPVQGTTHPQWASQFAPPPTPPVTQDKQPEQPEPNLKERPVIYGIMPTQTPAPTEPAQDPENLAAVEKPALSLIDRIKEALWLTPPTQTARQSSKQYAVRPQTPAGNQKEQYQTRPGKYAGGQNRAVKKDVLVAYLCWLCLGSHYIYLGKTRTQVIFWLTLGGCGLWWIIDGFNLSGMVKDYNIDQLLGNVLQTRARQNVREPKDIKVEKRSPGGPAEFK